MTSMQRIWPKTPNNMEQNRDVQYTFRPETLFIASFELVSNSDIFQERICGESKHIQCTSSARAPDSQQIHFSPRAM